MTPTEAKNTSSDEPLWTTREVAAYLALVDRQGKPNPELVSQVMIRDPNFPRPVKVGASKKARNRFEPAEIRAYRAALPRGGDGKPEVNADGSPAQKRGRKPKAVLGGGGAA